MAVFDTSIDFSMQMQQQDQWCWSAAGTSVSIFYDPAHSPWTQCTLATAVIPGASNCCPKSPACNVLQPLESALGQTQNLNVQVPGALTFEQLQGELAAKRAVAARSDFDGTGHFVVIAATSSIDHRVRICDPQHGTTEPTYDEFRTAYLSSGRWTTSYFTQQFLNPPGPAPPASMLPGAVGRVLQPPKPRAVSGRRARTARSAVQEIFASRLDDLVEGGGGLAASRHVGWQRIVETVEGDAYALESPVQDTDPRDATVSRGPYAAQALDRARDATAQLRGRGVGARARTLRILGLRLVAVWLKAASDDDDIIIPMTPAPAELEGGKLYRRAEIEPLLAELAVRQRERNALATGR